jgi:tetratricopeptide (TPR) repeat protein
MVKNRSSGGQCDSEKSAGISQERNFESAVKIAIEPIDGRKPDDFLLRTTAITYFQRAQADKANGQRWITLAVQYSERALEMNPDDLVNIFNPGESYMVAGMNLTESQACDYYDKSLSVFERLKAQPALKGEWGTIEGQRVQLEPYRQKLDQHMENVRLLASKCPTFQK